MQSSCKWPRKLSYLYVETILSTMSQHRVAQVLTAHATPVSRAPYLRRGVTSKRRFKSSCALEKESSSTRVEQVERSPVLFYLTFGLLT